MNPSSNVRSVIYLLTVFLNALFGTVQTQVELPIVVVAILAGYNAVVAAMAKSNVTPEE